jgi:hypothetical protein
VLSSTAVLQRVTSASVTVDSHLVSSIGKGVLVFAAVAAEDTRKEVESMAAKVLKLKLWPDESGASVFPIDKSSSYMSRTHVPRSGSEVCKISREKSSVVCEPSQRGRTSALTEIVAMQYPSSRYLHPLKRAISLTSTARLVSRRQRNCTIILFQRSKSSMTQRKLRMASSKL